MPKHRFNSLEENKNHSLIRRVKWIFFTSVFLLLALSILSYYSFQRFLTKAEWVNHTNEVLLRLENILSFLKDAETGQRGYLLTHNPDYLEPYIGSYGKVFENYNEVKELTLDNNNQQRRLDTLKILINDKFQNIDLTINLQEKGEEDSIRRILSTGEGKRIMDAIRVMIYEMEEEERGLKEMRFSAVKSSSYITPFLVFITSVAALVIVIISYVLVFRDLKARVRVEEKLFINNQELEALNEELKVREEELSELNLMLEEKIDIKGEQIEQGQKRIREIEERYKLLINNVRDYAIFLMDEFGDIISWNYGAERIKGYKESEIIGKNFRILYPDDQRVKRIPEKDLMEAEEKGQILYEGWRRKKDDTLFWASGVLLCIKNDKGKVVGFSKITRDLSERKKIEDELRRLNSDLDTFVYTASHDLKAPISNLEGLIHAVWEEIKSQCSKEVSEYFDMMNSSIERLRLIISELSAVSSIQKDGGEDKEPVPLSELIDEFKLIYKDEIKKLNAKIYSDLTTDELFFSKKILGVYFITY